MFGKCALLVICRAGDTLRVRHSSDAVATGLTGRVRESMTDGEERSSITGSCLKMMLIR